MPRPLALRPQDVLLACKLYALGEARRDFTYLLLAGELGLSVGEAHNSVDRCRAGGICLPSREVSREALRDLLVVAAPRIFYAARGAVAAGIPTGTAAAPLRGRFAVEKGVLPIVWPRAGGGRRGESVEPIYPSAPAAALRDGVVYELLALVDVLRVGSRSERELAIEMVDERLLGRRERKTGS